jgi:hypothetical protein
MSLFNYIDTFFFISLGITFVLLLLLVFHFKSRLAALEEKTDTIFEIMNNMVLELNNMKRSHYSPSIQAIHTPVQTVYDNTKTVNTPPSKKITVSEDESDGDDSETDSGDSDSDDSDSDSGDSDSDDDGMEISMIPNYHGAILETLTKPAHDITDTLVVEEIAVDEIDESEVLDLMEEETDETDKTDKTDKTDEIKTIEINVTEPITEIDIEKVDHSEPEESIASSAEPENKNIHTMSIQELRKIVSNRGLAQNASKLKKNELIQLLEKESL